MNFQLNAVLPLIILLRTSCLLTVDSREVLIIIIMRILSLAYRIFYGHLIIGPGSRKRGSRIPPCMWEHNSHHFYNCHIHNNYVHINHFHKNHFHNHNFHRYYFHVPNFFNHHIRNRHFHNHQLQLSRFPAQDSTAMMDQHAILSQVFLKHNNIWTFLSFCIHLLWQHHDGLWMKCVFLWLTLASLLPVEPFTISYFSEMTILFIGKHMQM